MLIRGSPPAMLLSDTAERNMAKARLAKVGVGTFLDSKLSLPHMLLR